MNDKQRKREEIEDELDVLNSVLADLYDSDAPANITDDYRDYIDALYAELGSLAAPDHKEK